MKKLRFLVNILIVLFLLIITVYTFYNVYTLSSTLSIRHYIGFFFTIATFLYVFVNRNIFTLLLGINLLIGNFCGLTVLANFYTSTFGMNIWKMYIPFYWGNEVYSVLLIIYILFNARFYVGILSRNYWFDFLTRTEDLKRNVIVIDVSDRTTK
jgi:hypothetical protein